MNIALGNRFAATIQPKQLLARKDQFRGLFKGHLADCVRHRLSIEETFGVIWIETLSEVSLTELEESELYLEMIAWAKECIRLGPDCMCGCQVEDPQVSDFFPEMFAGRNGQTQTENRPR